MAVEFNLDHKIVVHAPIEGCFLLSTSLAIVDANSECTPFGGVHQGS